MSEASETETDTRTAILNVAAELFARRGYTRTSIADISNGLGLTKGALYFHFDSKAALAVEIAQRYFRIWQPILEAVDSKSERGLTALQSISLAVARHYRDNVLVQAAVRLFNEANEIDAELPLPFVDWIDLVSKYLREEIGDGGLPQSLEVESTAWFLVASFFGTQDISNQLSGRQDIEEKVRFMWKVVIHGLVDGKRD